MPLKIYKRIGLRRDQNLADTSNRVTSLNNLLDGLSNISGGSFISEDLNAIRDLYVTGITSTEYQQIVDSTVQVTDESGSNSTAIPLINFKNRLDIFSIFTNSTTRGGNGLTASYYANANVDEDTDNIFTGTPFKTDNFWEDGEFNYSGKLDPTSIDGDGGILWEGFFGPTQTGSYTFRINSVNCYTFEFEKETHHTNGTGDKYEELARCNLTKTVSGSATGAGSQITLTTASDTVNVSIGMSASTSGTNRISDTAKVSEINSSTGVITFTADAGNPVTGSFSGSNNVTFFKTMGQSTRDVITIPYVLNKLEKYCIRIRYFIPSAAAGGDVGKSISFDLSTPLSGGAAGDLRYTSLYGTDYDFSNTGKGIFETFIDNSIEFGGTTLIDALGGGTDKDDYIKIKTTKKIDVKYQPKTSVSSITRSTISCTSTNNSTVLSINNTNNIEVGNIIFGTGIPNDTVVKDILINNFIIMNNDATITDTNTLSFIDHRGFVKKVTGSTSGTTLTISSGNTTNLRTGMIVLGNAGSGDFTAYTGITTIPGNSTQVTLSSSQSMSSTELYFYQDQGLINDSLSAFCTPVSTECLVVTTETNAGNTTIPVSGTAALDNSATYRVLGSQFAANTQITTINTNNIVINNNTTAKLLVGEKVTVTKESSDIDLRVLCCPPKDTSPPFTPTENGLSTKTIRPNLQIADGNLKFDSLSATGISTVTALSAALNENSTRTFGITTPSGLFKIMCE